MKFTATTKTKIKYNNENEAHGLVEYSHAISLGRDAFVKETRKQKDKGGKTVLISKTGKRISINGVSSIEFTEETMPFD